MPAKKKTKRQPPIPKQNKLIRLPLGLVERVRKHQFEQGLPSWNAAAMNLLSTHPAVKGGGNV